MFVTVTVFSIVFGIVNRWKELLTLACIVLFLWLLLMAVRCFVLVATGSSPEQVRHSDANIVEQSQHPPAFPVP
jgi:hypothetical protein